jgi:NADH dehydrogenase/NADH:ubiquinone oxidoreductase subunit G
MITFKINDHQVKVKECTTVLNAAKSLGLNIPHTL